MSKVLFLENDDASTEKTREGKNDSIIKFESKIKRLIQFDESKCSLY